MVLAYCFAALARDVGNSLAISPDHIQPESTEHREKAIEKIDTEVVALLQYAFSLDLVSWPMLAACCFCWHVSPFALGVVRHAYQAGCRSSWCMRLTDMLFDVHAGQAHCMSLVSNGRVSSPGTCTPEEDCWVAPVLEWPAQQSNSKSRW